MANRTIRASILAKQRIDTYADLADRIASRFAGLDAVVARTRAFPVLTESNAAEAIAFQDAAYAERRAGLLANPEQLAALCSPVELKALDAARKREGLARYAAAHTRFVSTVTRQSYGGPWPGDDDWQ